MIQQISPWSIYDQNFTQQKLQNKQKQQQKYNSKTIDYTSNISNFNSAQLYNPQKYSHQNYINKLKFRLKRKNDQKNKHQKYFYKINTLSQQKITSERHHLEETLHQIILLKIIKQQLSKQQRQEYQKNIVKNIIQFKNHLPSQKLEFPKIQKYNRSVLLLPQKSKQYYQMNSYKKIDRQPGSYSSGTQFNDQKFIQKSIELFKNKKRNKKLSSLLFLNNNV